MRILYLLFAFLCLMMLVAPAKLPYKGRSGGGSPKNPENVVVDATKEFIQGNMEEVRRICEEAGGYCATELCHPGDEYIQICHRRRPCCRKIDDALQV